ncbi:MAG TPA: heat-inducible transcription repressor HrcA [bacterium]|nr:heat-inducible transcription repressor HrcA [bacterium]
MSLPILNERAQHLLKVLVERYIDEGVPVGSRTLAQSSALSLSAASVRNVMADLEDLELIHAPHTSAGRVPTIQGYRLFINKLLTSRPLDERELHHLQGELQHAHGSRQQLIETASQMLSQLTGFTGLVTLPKREQVNLLQIELIPLSTQRVLAILVMSDGEVQNRVLPTPRNYSAQELHQLAAQLTERLTGHDPSRVREHLVHEMDSLRSDLNALMQETIRLTEQTLVETAPDLVISGQSKLLARDDISSRSRMQSLFAAFESKRELLHFFDQSQRADGVQIFIGSESGYAPLEECSLITAPYREEGRDDGRIIGYLGIIGPTRMPYDQIIPRVDMTARLLGMALNPANPPAV